MDMQSFILGHQILGKSSPAQQARVQTGVATTSARGLSVQHDLSSLLEQRVP